VEYRRFEDECATTIIGAAIEVQSHLGPGLVESAYEAALCHELGLRDVHFERQLRTPAIYKGLVLPDAYRVDVLVEHAVVVEIKAVEQLLPIHQAQLLTYLRFTGKRLGLLLNFHATPLKAGIRRIANQL
jgi:GxxExxY protein